MAVLTLVALGGCGPDGPRSLVSPEAPTFQVGPTVSVTVNCPTPLTPGASGNCTAYGWDAQARFTSSQAYDWSSTDAAVASVSASGSTGQITAHVTGSTTVSAKVDGVVGSQLVRVQPDIFINGPDQVVVGEICSFFATVTAGTAPYSYVWGEQNATRTFAYTPNEPWTWTGSSSASSFMLYLTVTDASGESASVWKAVTTDADPEDILAACVI